MAAAKISQGNSLLIRSDPYFYIQYILIHVQLIYLQYILLIIFN